MRYIPKPSTQLFAESRLRQRRFLIAAQQAGWHPVGVDVDPRAAALARHRGLDIKVFDINILANNPAFDGIILNHIIEHLHDPVAVITACYHLLKPGGWLWLETLNIDSQKHQVYGEYWRGLKAPRHLILFNNNSLRFLLSTTGFEHIEPLPYRPVCRGVFGQSAAFAKLAGCVPITNYESVNPLPKRRRKKPALILTYANLFPCGHGNHPVSGFNVNQLAGLVYIENNSSPCPTSLAAGIYNLASHFFNLP